MDEKRVEQLLLELLERQTRLEEKLSILQAHSARLERLEDRMAGLEGRVAKIFAIGAGLLLAVQILTPWMISLFKRFLERL